MAWVRDTLWVVREVESDREFRPLEVFQRGWRECIDLPSGELLLPLGLVCSRPAENRIELMFWIRECKVALLLVLVPVGSILRRVL